MRVSIKRRFDHLNEMLDDLKYDDAKVFRCLFLRISFSYINLNKYQ